MTTRQRTQFIALAVAASTIPLSGSLPAQDVTPPPEVDPAFATPADGVDESGVEVLTHGPVHEAFARPTADELDGGFIVPKAPPEPIDELPPEYMPEGDNVEWIPGYWAWDSGDLTDEGEATDGGEAPADAKENESETLSVESGPTDAAAMSGAGVGDFVWVSGLWRNVPPGQRWVPGYWSEAEGGYRWTSGFWTGQEIASLDYLPYPPASLDQGPNVAAPNAESFWVPGSWIYQSNDYQWQPGYWAPAHDDWCWVPQRNNWTPRGALYSPGYWDYRVPNRGLLFAPVRFGNYGYYGGGRRFTPGYVINPAGLLVSLFVRPSYRHYYFGNYYGNAYRNRGYRPWFDASYGGRYRYDPMLAFYESYYDRRGIDFSGRINQWHRYYENNPNRRPPRTWSDTIRVADRADADTNQIRLARSLSDIADAGVGRGGADPDNVGQWRFRKLSQDQQVSFSRSADDFREFVRDRSDVENRRRSRDVDVGGNPTVVETRRPVRADAPSDQPRTDRDADRPSATRRPGASEPDRAGNVDEQDRDRSNRPGDERGARDGLRLPEPTRRGDAILGRTPQSRGGDASVRDRSQNQRERGPQPDAAHPSNTDRARSLPDSDQRRGSNRPGNDQRPLDARNRNLEGRIQPPQPPSRRPGTEVEKGLQRDESGRNRLPTPNGVPRENRTNRGQIAPNPQQRGDAPGRQIDRNLLQPRRGNFPQTAPNDLNRRNVDPRERIPQFPGNRDGNAAPPGNRGARQGGGSNAPAFGGNRGGGKDKKK